MMVRPLGRLVVKTAHYLTYVWELLAFRKSFLLYHAFSVWLIFGEHTACKLFVDQGNQVPLTEGTLESKNNTQYFHMLQQETKS